VEDSLDNLNYNIYDYSIVTGLPIGFIFK